MDGNRNGKDSPGGRGIWIVAACVCAACFLGCVIWLFLYMGNNRRAQDGMETLRQEYAAAGSEEQPPDAVEQDGTGPGESEETENTPEPTPEPSPLQGYDIPDRNVDITAMQENENPDIYAWITVPGTQIDYPVLQHPKQLDYYLDHNVDRSSGYPGCIYSQYVNSLEWDDPNTVLYGHNMKNGSMFAGLHLYEDPDFLEENPYVYIFTQRYVRVYHIFGAYEYDNRHLLLTGDMWDAEVFADYLEEIKGLDGMRDNFLTDVPVSAKDKVLTLETCVSHKPERRYIVQAVLEAEGVWPEGAAENP